MKLGASKEIRLVLDIDPFKGTVEITTLPELSQVDATICLGIALTASLEEDPETKDLTESCEGIVAELMTRREEALTLAKALGDIGE